MNGKLFLVLAAIAALIIGVLMTGCFGSKAVTVAVAVPLTGEDAAEGQSIVNAVQLCVDEWNAKGGLFGKPVKLVVKDDKESSETAVAVANELSTDKVDAVIGHYNSSCTLAARDVYFSNRILMITPSSTNPAVTDGIYPTIFRVCGRDDDQGKTAAEYVAKAWPDAKVALLHDDSSYGKGLSDKFLFEFTSATKKESVLYKHFDRSVSDFSALAAEIKSKEPTLIYFGGLFLQGGGLVKAIRSAGCSATFFSGDGCFNQGFIDKAGPAAENAYVTFNPKPEGTAEGLAFAKAYQSKFGEAPHPYSLFAYTAAQVALTAIHKAQSKDSIVVSKVIHSQEFETPMGPLKFNQKGDPENSPWTIWKVEGGKFVTAPEPVAQAAPAEEPKGN